MLGHGPKVQIRHNEIITGSYELGIEAFKGIPFADPPIGDYRFKPPRPFTGSYRNFDATRHKAGCMQLMPWQSNDNEDSWDMESLLPESVKKTVMDWTHMKAKMNEDCLHLNIFRPRGTKQGEKLPVMVWIFGGAFLVGSAATYRCHRMVWESMSMNQPVIFITINYRTGLFGFMGGEAIWKEGSANAGLRDQRIALEWVQDYIYAFGGDPERVTIIGESAGAMSIAHQMVANNGNNWYKGERLFHRAIMQSGGVLPYLNVTSLRPTQTYKRILAFTGCSSKESGDAELECLRKLPTEVLHDAQNSHEGILNEFLGFSPRPDGYFIKESTFELFKRGQYTAIPFIAGTQEDEGTLFAPFMINASTTAHLKSWFQYIFPKASVETVDTLLKHYPSSPRYGSPFRTSILNALTPQYKRIAALLGDILFQSPRRLMSRMSIQPRWVYHSTQLHHIVPFLGTFHANDLIFQFEADHGPYLAYRRYFIAFANHGDPNIGTGLTYWKEYGSSEAGRETGGDLLEIGLHNVIMRDNGDTFRETEIKFLVEDQEKELMA